jgi:Bacterial TSP3 repeat
MRTFAAAIAALVALLIPAAGASAKPTTAGQWAKRHHLKGHWRSQDADRDGLTNLREFKLKTDPRKADTDRDGLGDGDELKAGDDPLARDSDGDGVKDGAEHAGVVTAFDGTTLTVRQFHGRTVTATVDPGVDCFTAGDDSSADDSSADDAGDDSSADDTSGDDPSTDDTGDDTSADDPSADDSDVSADDSSADAEPTCADLGVKPGAVVAHLELDRDDAGNLVVSEIELAG